MQRLFRLWNLLRHIVVVVLQPGHLSMAGRVQIGRSCRQGLNELRPYSVYKAADGAIDGIGAFKLYEVRRDGDDDVLRALDAARDGFVILAQEDCIALTKDDKRGDTQLL